LVTIRSRFDFQIDRGSAGHHLGMQHSSGVADRGWLMGALTLAIGVASACGGANDPGASKPTPSGIFGGAGGGAGVAEAVPLSGSSGSASAGNAGNAGSATGECQNTPPGTLALLDDFDDGDSVAAFEPGRDAYWFTVHDESAGTLEPPGGFLPVAGGYRDSKAAHVSASGFVTWGAELSANISYKSAVRCPFDASAFAGLRFVARGSGRVRVQLAMPGVVDKEYGGTCDPQAGQICYDDHGSFVTLREQYQVYELPWASFQQRGFGRQMPFDPRTIHSLHFTMETAELPVDLWLDDVKFWDGQPSDDGVGGEGGAGGAGGAGAMGGAGGEVDAGGAPLTAGAGGAG